MDPNERNITINKLSLILNFFLVIFAFLALFGTPIFKPLWQGRLSESIESSEYKVKYKEENYFISTFRYEHVSGNCINDLTLLYIVENTGAKIDDYDPYFKTLYTKDKINQYKDESSVKLEIPLIRKDENFHIVFYSKNRAKIKSTIRMSDGILIYPGHTEKEIIRSPAIWVSIIIIGVFMLMFLVVKKNITQIQREKERIIGERNAYQNLHMQGERISSNSDIIKRKKTTKSKK